MSARLQISGAPARGDCKVLLDGEDITGALTGLVLDMQAGELPTARLDVRVTELPGVDTQVRAHLAPEARELLVRLGWTPPTEGGPA